jgi:uncharacterized phage protein (TIGR02220 family)
VATQTHVTERDPDVPFRDEESQNVTPASHQVTDGHSQSLRTVPYRAVQDCTKKKEILDAPAAPARGRSSRKPKAPTEAELGIVERVLGKLTERSGRTYDPKTAGHSQRILRLLHEGYTEDDLRVVVWDRGNAWADDPKFSQYLQPSTLFGPDKFAERLVLARAAWNAAGPPNGSAGAAKSNPAPTEFTRTLLGDRR